MAHQADFVQADCRTHLSYSSSLVRRAGCVVDGKGLGFAADRPGFESWLNNLLDGEPGKLFNYSRLVSKMEMSAVSQHVKVTLTPHSVHRLGERRRDFKDIKQD